MARASATTAGRTSGLAFFILFVTAQWTFASFLLSPSADHWFFAGGGRQWPVFNAVAPGAANAFWTGSALGEPFNFKNATIAMVLAIVSSRVGLWLGAWLARVKQ